MPTHTAFTVVVVKGHKRTNISVRKLPGLILFLFTVISIPNNFLPRIPAGYYLWDLCGINCLGKVHGFGF